MTTTLVAHRVAQLAASARWTIPSCRRRPTRWRPCPPVGQPEEDDAGDAQPAQALDLHGQRVEGVLDDAGKRRDGPRLGESVRHEQGGHQVVDDEARLGHQPAHGRGAAEPAEANDRKPGSFASAFDTGSSLMGSTTSLVGGANPAPELRRLLGTSGRRSG